jgi:hypothetical protein
VLDPYFENSRFVLLSRPSDKSLGFPGAPGGIRTPTARFTTGYAMPSGTGSIGTRTSGNGRDSASNAYNDAVSVVSEMVAGVLADKVDSYRYCGGGVIIGGAPVSGIIMTLVKSASAKLVSGSEVDLPMLRISFTIFSSVELLRMSRTLLTTS